MLLRVCCDGVALGGLGELNQESVNRVQDDLGLQHSSAWSVFDVWSDQEINCADWSSSAKVSNIARNIPAHGVEIMVLEIMVLEPRLRAQPASAS